jgi:hypothetical protein
MNDPIEEIKVGEFSPLFKTVYYLQAAFLEVMLCSIWALLTAMTTISRLITSGGRRSMASRRVSSQALATTWKQKNSVFKRI